MFHSELAFASTEFGLPAWVLIGNATLKLRGTGKFIEENFITRLQIAYFLGFLGSSRVFGSFHPLYSELTL